MEQLVDADCAGRLRSGELLSDLAFRENLWAAAERVLPAMGKCSETRRRYHTSLKKLRERSQPGRDAQVNDLLRVEWKRLAGSWKESSADWNHLRRAVSTFLSTQFDDVHHLLRRAVMKQIPTADEGTDRESDVTGSPFRFVKVIVLGSEKY